MEADTKGLFNWKTWLRAITFKRKVEGIDNLNLKCPICNAGMERIYNEGLNFEEKLFGVCPYYCKKCKKDTDDYVIYNVGWRSEESKLGIYMIIFLVVGLGIIALIKLLR